MEKKLQQRFKWTHRPQGWKLNIQRIIRQYRTTCCLKRHIDRTIRLFSWSIFHQIWRVWFCQAYRLVLGCFCQLSLHIALRQCQNQTHESAASPWKKQIQLQIIYRRLCTAIDPWTKSKIALGWILHPLVRHLCLRMAYRWNYRNLHWQLEEKSRSVGMANLIYISSSRIHFSIISFFE